MNGQNYSVKTNPLQPKTAKQVARRNNRLMLERAANPQDMWGVAPWGIPALDKLTGGIQSGTNNWLGGRPGCGKSGLVLLIMEAVARHFQANVNVDQFMDEETGQWTVREKEKKDWLHVGMILTEMDAEEMDLRAACSIAGTSTDALKAGRVSPAKQQRITEAQRQMAELPIVYYDNLETLRDVETVLQKSEPKIGFWILDHVGHFIDASGQNSTASAVAAAMKIQQLCRTYSPGLIVAHMNRASESNAGHRPTLNNYAGTDQIGKNADLGLAIHRPYMFEDLPPDQKNGPQPAELLMLKNRRGKAIDINMLYNPAQTKFIEQPGMNDLIYKEEGEDNEPTPLYAEAAS